MKRRGTSTRRASATTTRVPDHSRPRDRAPVGRSSLRSAPATLVKAGRLQGVREQRQQLRVVSCLAGVSSIEIGSPQPSTARWTP